MLGKEQLRSAISNSVYNAVNHTAGDRNSRQLAADPQERCSASRITGRIAPEHIPV